MHTINSDDMKNKDEDLCGLLKEIQSRQERIKQRQQQLNNKMTALKERQRDLELRHNCLIYHLA